MLYITIIITTIWISFLLLLVFCELRSKISFNKKLIEAMTDIEITHLTTTLDIAESYHAKEEDYDKCASIVALKEIIEEARIKSINNEITENK